ncbi:hypothetical protein GALMADRAFT_218487 [Galerina marginata CBS 339.88]|uniref:Uncharacterized protein n=1 Tax=Galerina marginata (strain CBS 339.88) TaxID=685588 RepID=A0A067U203_GALM3|nr:hypothetical protein GALMADRAFT_218487 [Galerina marginata CBS 339.88]
MLSAASQHCIWPTHLFHALHLSIFLWNCNALFPKFATTSTFDSPCVHANNPTSALPFGIQGS